MTAKMKAKARHEARLAKRRPSKLVRIRTANARMKIRRRRGL